ncbi:Hypothetical protein HVR_LOCUS1156 [uncultured virus]|nr:Hypothetical protein HVR_LOCUS1156 [uncultured virus]
MGRNKKNRGKQRADKKFKRDADKCMPEGGEYENFLKYMNDECNKKIKDVEETQLNEFHKFLDESVPVVRRYFENSKDIESSLAYYATVVAIATMMRDNIFVVTKSAGAHDWYKRFIRLRSSYEVQLLIDENEQISTPTTKRELVDFSSMSKPTHSGILNGFKESSTPNDNQEVTKREKELMVIIDEIIEKYSEFFVPQEIYSPTVIYNCLSSMIEAIGHNQTTEQRLGKIWAAAHFAIHYQEDFQYLIHIPLNTRSHFITPIHGVMIAQNRTEPILDLILADPKSTKKEKELCNFYLEDMKEFRRVFVSILIRK